MGNAYRRIPRANTDIFELKESLKVSEVAVAMWQSVRRDDEILTTRGGSVCSLLAFTWTSLWMWCWRFLLKSRNVD